MLYFFMDMAFLIFIVITTFTPGPNNISAATFGLHFGYRKTLNYLLGIFSGFFVMMIITGLFADLISRILPKFLLRFLGAAYIIWLAVSLFWGKKREKAAKNRFVYGFLLQWLNVKAILFGISLHVTFLVGISFPTLIVYAFILAALTFIAISAWALFGKVLQTTMPTGRANRIVNVIMFLLLIYTAITILLE